MSASSGKQPEPASHPLSTTCSRLLRFLDSVHVVDGTNLHPWDRLNAVDPKLAQRIHRNDTYRINRGLDVFSETGVPLSEQMQKFGGRYGNARFDALFLWLDADESVLLDRINKRVDVMMEEGM